MHRNDHETWVYVEGFDPVQIDPIIACCVYGPAFAPPSGDFFLTTAVVIPSPYRLT